MKKTLLSISCFLILLMPFNSSAEIVLNSEYQIPAVSINKNISLVIRVLCFDEKIIVMASNSKGADLTPANESCGKESKYSTNMILDQELIYGKNLAPNKTGLIRKILVRNKFYLVYSGKSGKPVIKQEGYDENT